MYNMDNVPVVLLQIEDEGDHGKRNMPERDRVTQMPLASGCRRATGKPVTTVVPSHGLAPLG